MDPEFRVSPLAMAVLSLLHAGPLHPYAMQRLIKEWGKDRVINVGQRANLYKTIRRLQDAGLVAVRQTERDQNYPERTVYELTEAGRELWPVLHALVVWGEHHDLPNSRTFRHAACGTELNDGADCPTCGITPAAGDILTEPRPGRGRHRDDPVAVALRGPHRLLEPLAVD